MLTGFGAGLTEAGRAGSTDAVLITTLEAVLIFATELDSKFATYIAPFSVLAKKTGCPVIDAEPAEGQAVIGGVGPHAGSAATASTYWMSVVLIEVIVKVPLYPEYPGIVWPAMTTGVPTRTRSLRDGLARSGLVRVAVTTLPASLNALI